LAALIPLLLTYHALLFYGFLANAVLYALLFVAFMAYLFIDWRNSLILSCALLGATLLLNFLVGLVGIDDRIYYREHERFGVYNSDLQADTYRKNVDVTLKEPFGDVYAVGGAKGLEAEPRTVRFRTDSLGFRNEAAYKGQKYVLVGDSFVVANGCSQEDMLASQLKDGYGIDAYTLAYPGGIPEYVRFIRYLERKSRDDFRVLLFLFEGNDFPESYSRKHFVVKKNFIKALFATYRSFFKETTLYRYTFSLAASRKKKPFTSTVLTVKGHKIGDFNEYVHATERQSYNFPERGVQALAGVSGRIDHIFFIPTKFRVYYDFLDSGKGNPLPDAQWEAVKALGARLKIPCTDLTAPLVADSAELLKKDRFTFWKDDSHWNRQGIAVAAGIVASRVGAGK
jgi:hypothetical protein